MYDLCDIKLLVYGLEFAGICWWQPQQGDDGENAKACSVAAAMTRKYARIMRREQDDNVFFQEKMSLLKQRNITDFVNKKNLKLIFFWESNNLKIIKYQMSI